MRHDRILRTLSTVYISETADTVSVEVRYEWLTSKNSSWFDKTKFSVKIIRSIPSCSCSSYIGISRLFEANRLNVQDLAVQSCVVQKTAAQQYKHQTRGGGNFGEYLKYKTGLSRKLASAAQSTAWFISSQDLRYLSLTTKRSGLEAAVLFSEPSSIFKFNV